MNRSGNWCRSRRNLGFGELQQEIADQFSVELLVIGLVAISHQTVVTGRFTGLFRARSFAAIFTCGGVEVADFQRTAANLHEIVPIKQSAQYSRASLGRLIKKNQVPQIAAWKWLRRQLVVLQFKLDLDGVL